MDWRENDLKPTCRPVTGILVGTKCHMFPEATGVLVAQVLAIETDLVVTFSHRGLVLGHYAIVGEEWGDHVDKVGPRGVMSKLERIGALDLPELQLGRTMGNGTVIGPWNGV